MDVTCHRCRQTEAFWDRIDIEFNQRARAAVLGEPENG
jgi:hypothetical protein